MPYTTKLYHIRTINIDLPETTGCECRCSFCECGEDDKHIPKNKVLMSRIHKCRIVDILTETQYIDMYERIRNTQIETYNKYGKTKRMILISRIREK